MKKERAIEVLQDMKKKLESAPGAPNNESQKEEITALSLGITYLSPQKLKPALATSRPAILETAKERVGGPQPEDNFQCIADFWSTYKGVEITPLDVAMMMTLLKVARARNGSASADNFASIAGYAACAGEVSKAT